MENTFKKEQEKGLSFVDWMKMQQPEIDLEQKAIPILSLDLLYSICNFTCSHFAGRQEAEKKTGLEICWRRPWAHASDFQEHPGKFI